MCIFLVLRIKLNVGIFINSARKFEAPDLYIDTYKIINSYEFKNKVLTAIRHIDRGGK